MYVQKMYLQVIIYTQTYIINSFILSNLIYVFLFDQYRNLNEALCINGTPLKLWLVDCHLSITNRISINAWVNQFIRSRSFVV